MLDRIDQINQLLDGDLDQMLESGLYAELSVNPDLRSELRSQLVVRSAVQSDRMALIPPAQLTNSVFTNLGFTAPLAGAAAGAAGGSLLLSWLTKIGLPVLSALAASGITYVASQNLGNSETQKLRSSESQKLRSSESQELRSSETQKPRISESQELRSSEDEGLNGVELKSSSQETTTIRHDETRFADMRRRIAGLQDENDALRAELDAERSRTLNATSQPSSEPEQLVEAPETPLRRVTVQNEFLLTRDENQRIISPSAFPTDNEYIAYPNPLIQIRGYSLRPTLESAVPEESNWYSNIGVGFFYRLDPNHMMGLEVGSEAFPLVYRGEENGQLKQWDQSSSLGWMGVSYRYTFNSFKDLPISPFAQIFGGGTKLGPLGRAMVGLEYSPTGPFSFILGAETAVLAYRFGSSWYASPKYGLTYGMSIRF